MSWQQKYPTEELFSIFSLHGFVFWRKEDALMENASSLD
jgi:hypothetical protein